MSIPLDKLTFARAVFVEANRHRLIEYGTRVYAPIGLYPYFVFRVHDFDDGFVDSAIAVGLAWVTRDLDENLVVVFRMSEG